MFKGILTDRAALYGIATKVAQGVAGIVTAILILKFFSPDVQGYYYTFTNILAVQVFLELGLSAVITTFAAHEWTALNLNGRRDIVGDFRALTRLKSLTRKVIKWYAIGGALLLFLLILIGFWFFDRQGKASIVDWQYPWIAMSALAAVSFVLTPFWALLAGCGQIGTLSAYRMAETFLRYAVSWSFISLGANLWAAVVAIAMSTIAGCIFLLLRYRRFFRTLIEKPLRDEFSWVNELVPLQIRIAVSWISGYFAFSLFTPAMFYFAGAGEAGRMGMTWAFVSGLSGIAGTWLQVRAPAFAMMVAKKEFETLDLAVRRITLIGVAVFILECGVGLTGLAFLNEHRPEIAARFIPVGPVLVFLIAECLHQVSMVQSTYLRAFKQEPFLGVSVASGLIIGGGTLWLTSKLGVYGPALSYLAGATVALTWGTFIFVQNRRQWSSLTAG